MQISSLQSERMASSSSIDRSSSSSSSIFDHPPEWLLSIIEEGNLLERLLRSQDPIIHKVPSMFLHDIATHADSFGPMVVSFGPYHHGKEKLAMIENLKPIIAKQLVSGTDQQDYFQFVRIARDAREYYDKDSTTQFGDEEFRRMMFLDGCFLLYSLDCILKGSLTEDSKINNYQMAFLARDILLLENQLPYIVLQTLMSFNIIPRDKEENLVIEFIERSYCRSSRVLVLEDHEDQPPHLLHLLRKALVGTAPHHDSDTSDEINDWHTFRSVSKLKAGGIECKRSSSTFLKDVSFIAGCFCGILYLPQIVVDDNTKTMLLNLVAYEACPDFLNDDAVTSYICFMDALIGDAEDVKLLRSKEILVNSLGSDEMVADLFHDLATNLVPSKYLKVKGNIEKYYEKKSVIWITEMLKTHLRSPWTAIGFLVAVVIILLTIIPSYFSFFSRGGGGGERRPKTGKKFPFKN